MAQAAHSIEVDLPVEAFYGLVTDFEAYPAFLSDVKSARVLARKGHTWEAAFVARCRAWMAERLEDASPWLCWVAEADGYVLGCLWMQSIEKVPNPVDEPERHAYVTSVYVRPDRRGRGLETAFGAGQAQALSAVVRHARL